MALSGQQLRALQHLIRQQQQQDDGILTFRAGRMSMDDNKIVTAKNDRGKIKFSKGDDGLLHLEWINRISNKQDLDIMIFPDSAKWVRVEECKDGRVYVLKFNGSSRREFFWMQEPSEEKDSEICEKVNKLITTDESSRGGAAAAQQQQIAQSLGLGGFGGAGLGGLGGFGSGLGGLGALGGNTGATGASSGNTGSGNGAAAANGNNNDQLAQLFMNALQQQMGGATGGNQGGTGTTNGGTGATGGGGNPLMQAMLEQQLKQREELKKEPDLSDILDPSQTEIENVLDDEKVVERLAEHLPPQMRDTKSILEQLSSPQFLGSLARLNHIINSPQMTVLLQQMGIQPGDKVGVRAFIEAVMKQANQNSNNSDNNNNNNNDNSSNNNNHSGNDESAKK